MGPEEPSGLRDRIVEDLYTPTQLLQIGGKILKNRLVTPRMLLSPPGFLVRAGLSRFNPETGRGSDTCGRLCRFRGPTTDGGGALTAEEERGEESAAYESCRS